MIITPFFARTTHGWTPGQKTSSDQYELFKGGSLAVTKRPLAQRHCRRRAVGVVEARRGRRWWSESWELPPPSPEQIITIFSSDGTITTIPSISHIDSTDRSSSTLVSLPTPHDQGLCIGSIFTISATNGVDVTRRMNVLGFCQSIEMLHDSVERKVAQRGGEIFRVQRELKSGIHETLTMTLALPLLWGVPPEHERLKSGIERGGGIIDRVYQEWFIGTLN
ncbi:hypothetical protein Ndes2526B_g03526 [Nannochloris sp. 'desiccata']